MANVQSVQHLAALTLTYPPPPRTSKGTPILDTNLQARA